MTAPKSLPLFGGAAGSWKASDWTASDDRVRGGSSHSYLDILPCHPRQQLADVKASCAKFHGTLDTKTLGGAGFASQRTAATNVSWDLSEYSGIELRISSADAKRYTFILKDALLEPNPATGREQATVSWEFDFDVPKSRPHNSSSDSSCNSPGVSGHVDSCQDCQESPRHSGRRHAGQGTLASVAVVNGATLEADAPTSVDARLGPGSQPHSSDASYIDSHSKVTVLRIPWRSLRPTYRGREQKDVDPIDPASIKRFSIMMRSFFDEQHGDFELYIDSISAYKDEPNKMFSILSSLLRCFS